MVCNILKSADCALEYFLLQMDSVGMVYNFFLRTTVVKIFFLLLKTTVD